MRKTTFQSALLLLALAACAVQPPQTGGVHQKANPQVRPKATVSSDSAGSSLGYVLFEFSLFSWNPAKWFIQGGLNNESARWVQQTGGMEKSGRASYSWFLEKGPCNRQCFGTNFIFEDHTGDRRAGVIYSFLNDEDFFCVGLCTRPHRVELYHYLNGHKIFLRSAKDDLQDRYWIKLRIQYTPLYIQVFVNDGQVISYRYPKRMQTRMVKKGRQGIYATGNTRVVFNMAFTSSAPCRDPGQNGASWW